MEIVSRSAKVWGECPTDYDTSILWLEEGGRICYRSEDRIHEGSGIVFVNNIIKAGHMPVIEFSNMVVRTRLLLTAPYVWEKEYLYKWKSPFLKMLTKNDRLFIGGNFRAFMEVLNLTEIHELFSFFENNPDFEIVVDHADIPRELKVVIAEFITSRDVTHEKVRHRPCSFLQESQRYVKYDGPLKVVVPYQYDNIDMTDPNMVQRYTAWKQSVEYSAKTYRRLRALGEQAQEARSVLPNCTATKIGLRADLVEWDHIFHMRTSTRAFPGIRRLLGPVKEEFIQKGWM